MAAGVHDSERTPGTLRLQVHLNIFVRDVARCLLRCRTTKEQDIMSVQLTTRSCRRMTKARPRLLPGRRPRIAVAGSGRAARSRRSTRPELRLLRHRRRHHSAALRLSVDETEFDAIFGRVRERAPPSGPIRIAPDRGGVRRGLGRGFYFEDPSALPSRSSRAPTCRGTRRLSPGKGSSRSRSGAPHGAGLSLLSDQLMCWVSRSMRQPSDARTMWLVYEPRSRKELPLSEPSV